MPTVRLYTGTNVAADDTSDAGINTHMPVNSVMIAFIDVTAVSASDTLDVKLQDSTNGTDWSDVSSGAFTQAAAPTTEIIKVTNVAQYVRAYVDVTGAAIDISFTVDVAFSVPSTDGIQ